MVTVDATGTYRSALVSAFQGDTRPAIETLLRVQNKQGKLVPLVFKPVQEDYWKERSSADIILKAAQLGFTTIVQAEFFLDAMVIPGIEVLYLAQREETSKRLFEVTRRFYSTLPEKMRPPVTADTRNMLSFRFGDGSESTIMIGSAESKTFGRGRPVHRALFTEVGFYSPEAQNVVKGIIARMPPGMSRMVLESTANGQAGYFYESWVGAGSGGNSLKPHFFPWPSEPEYRIPYQEGTRWGGSIGDMSEEEIAVLSRFNLDNDQIRWRRWQRSQLGEAMFKQEFPETPDEAFLPMGSAVFDYATMDRLAKMTKEPVKKRSDGLMVLWQQKESSRNYIVSVDQSSGEMKDVNHRPTDWQCVTVWDSATLVQCARYRARVPMRTLAEEAVRLARYYNDALIVPERNLAQYGLTQAILDSYSNVYLHGDGKLGYPMNKSTKPVLKDGFISVTDSEGACRIYSDNLIHEARNYRYLSDGMGYRSMGAAPGGHDDELVTAFFAFDPEVRRQASVMRFRSSRNNSTGSATRVSRNRGQ